MYISDIPEIHIYLKYTYICKNMVMKTIFSLIIHYYSIYYSILYTFFKVMVNNHEIIFTTHSFRHCSKLTTKGNHNEYNYQMGEKKITNPKEGGEREIKRS